MGVDVDKVLSAYRLAEHPLRNHKTLVIAQHIKKLCSAPPQLQPQHPAALFLLLVGFPQTSALMASWILSAVLLLTFLFLTRIRLMPLSTMEKKPEKSRKPNENDTDFEYRASLGTHTREKNPRRFTSDLPTHRLLSLQEEQGEQEEGKILQGTTLRQSPPASKAVRIYSEMLNMF